MTDILDRLFAFATGGCTCATKTPVLEQHAVQCRYRLAEEAGIEIRALRKRRDELLEANNGEVERRREAERARARAMDLRDGLLMHLSALRAPLPAAHPGPMGCVCPPTAERTCQAGLCPRRGTPGLSPFPARASGLAPPVDAAHAVTKAYVDAAPNPAPTGARAMGTIRVDETKVTTNPTPPKEAHDG